MFTQELELVKRQNWKKKDLSGTRAEAVLKVDKEYNKRLKKIEDDYGIGSDEYNFALADKDVSGKFYVSELWGIVTEPNGLATPHNHWPAVFTFVYYLSLPEKNPPLVFTDSDLKIYPKEGELIFFPSWLKHEVPVNETSEERVCYAGNIYYEE